MKKNTKTITILTFLLIVLTGTNYAQVIRSEQTIKSCSVCSSSSSKLYQLPDGRLFCKRHILAVQQKCSSCGQQFDASNFDKIQYRNKSQNWVCQNCQTRQERCALCGTPVGRNNLGTRHVDSRIFCKKDSQNSVFTTGQVQQMFMDGKQILLKQVGPVMAIPIRASQVKLVDIPEMNQRLNLNTSDFSYTYGLTQTVVQATPDLSKTEIYIHSGLPKERVLETCIHEYAHAWLGAYGHRRIRFNRLAQEGFSEWVTQKAFQASDQEWVRKLKNKPKVYYQGWLFYKNLEQKLPASEILKALRRGELPGG